MAWTTSLADLRALLSDGASDKYRYRKRVINEVNGVNRVFKTFEFRRVTDFTSVTGDLGVYVNGALATVSSDTVGNGEFVLATAPTDGSYVEATYYIQWFLDAELNQFLRSGSQFLNFGDDPSNTPSGLQPACLKYAAHEAYQKLALRWAEHLSETYRTEDAPDKNRMSIVEQYQKMAETYLKEAKTLRQDYYTRNDQQNQPLFSSISGAVQDVVPPR